MRDASCSATEMEGCHKFICWKAVFAGAVVAVGLTFLFNLLTIGLGLTLFKPEPSEQAALAFGGMLWLFIGSFIILFMAGWSTGRLVSADCYSGVLHGFVTWSLFLIIGWLLLSIVTEPMSLGVLKSTYTQIDVSKGKATIETTTQINRLGFAGFMSFFLFLVAAIGSCIGACWAICANRKKSMEA